jgi:membrane fusion protein (multidrug efflux system)
MATLRAGMPVQMSVDAVAGKSFEGKIDRVSPVVDSSSGTFRVVCAFDSVTALRPGMFGRIVVVYDQHNNALTIPRVALLEDEGEPAVFVVRANKAVRTSVDLGYTNGEIAEVRAGLKEGDAVVTAGKVAIRDGSAVQVIASATAKPALADNASTGAVAQ